MAEIVSIPDDIPELAPVVAHWTMFPSNPKRLHAYPDERNQRFDVVGTIREFAVDRAIANAVSPVWAEFGVQNGAGANYWVDRLPQDHRLMLFDSFEGLPEDWNGSKAGHMKASAVPTWDDDRVEVIEGWFEDTLPVDEVLGFAHIDCDLYSSTKTVLERIKVVPGTVILFDELFGYEGYEDGELKALSEWQRPYRFIAKDTFTRAAIEVL